MALDLYSWLLAVLAVAEISALLCVAREKRILEVSTYPDGYLWTGEEDAAN